MTPMDLRFESAELWCNRKMPRPFGICSLRAVSRFVWIEIETRDEDPSGETVSLVTSSESVMQAMRSVEMGWTWAQQRKVHPTCFVDPLNEID